MKKIIFSLVCFVSIGNFALASSVDDLAIGTLEKQDSQAIFMDKIENKEVIILNDKQMEELKAKGWFSKIFREVGRVLGQLNNLVGVYPDTRVTGDAKKQISRQTYPVYKF